VKPILIETQNIGARTETSWNKDHTSRLAKIYIAEKDLQTTQGLTDLAFEVFNTQIGSESLDQEAKAGNVGMGIRMQNKWKMMKCQTPRTSPN
jgi:hypothetical protein